jgi:prepilin-type N-terminal cleavage/methylation domain-containing protein
MRRERGFTLIEILFAIFIGLILMGAAYVAMTSGYQTSAGVERKVSAQQDVRAALQVMGLELSMASYNPNYVSGIWQGLPLVGSTCAAAPPANLAYKGIQVATPTSIMVEMDLGENNAVGNDHGEIVLYNYDPVNQYITRETINCKEGGVDVTRGAGADQPFLGSSGAPGQPRGVRVINGGPGGLGIPVFRYFNAVGDPANELHPDVNPGDIPNIRRVDITLAVRTDEVDPSTKQRRQMIYSTSVFVRNHAIIQ